MSMMQFRFLSLLIVSILFAGCKKDPNEEATNLTVPGVLVDAAWVHANLEHPGLLLVDARSPEEYAQGHLPGAVNVPHTVLLDKPPRATDMAPVDQIQEIFGTAGIDQEHAVVVYGGSKTARDCRPPARVFWVLEMHGHSSVAVLNGGIEQWETEDLPLSTESVTPEPRSFVAQMQPNRLATQSEVSQAIETESATIIDTRSSEEYEGLASQADRKGHIPSAVHVDFNENVNSDDAVCSMHTLEELQAIYQEKIDTSNPVITYCNSGQRASVTYLALRSLDVDVSLYDGSWLEWGNSESLPIESESGENLPEETP